MGLAICQILKNNIGTNEILLHTGSNRAGNFKTLLNNYFTSGLCDTLCGHWLPWMDTGRYFSGQSAKFCKSMELKF